MTDLEVLVDGEGLKDVALVRVAPGEAAIAIVRETALISGLMREGDEVILFLEDEEGPLELTTVIDDSFIGRVHHVHRVRHIEVVVQYQNRHVKRRFSPATRVETVLLWAIGPTELNIDPAIAPEMELAVAGTEDPLPKSAHIGRFVQHPMREIKFDLIRGVIPNGASA